MTTSKPLAGQVLRALRDIRCVSREETAEAVSEHLFAKFTKRKDFLDSWIPLMAEQLSRLEENHVCETTHEKVFVLGEVLGLGPAHLIWWLDLVSPEARAYENPSARDVERKGAELLEAKTMALFHLATRQKLPIGAPEASRLYARTGLVDDPIFRDLLLSRFLRKPYRRERYQIGIVKIDDRSMWPPLGPGTLVLLDVMYGISASANPSMADPFYWCRRNKRHCCCWPIRREHGIGLTSTDGSGNWFEVSDAIILGAPRPLYWQAEPLKCQDFYCADFRDQEAAEYVQALRSLSI